MRDSGPLRPGDVEDLLQFLYVCPVGLIEFGSDGAVHRVNPAAVNLLAPAAGVVDVANVFDVFAGAPELVSRIRRAGPRPGQVVHDYPLRFAGAPGWTLAVTVVRVTATRLMAVLRDASSAAARAGLRDALEPVPSRAQTCQLAADALVKLGGAAAAVVWSLDDGTVTAVGSAGAAALVDGSGWSSSPSSQAWRLNRPVTIGQRATLEADHHAWAALLPADAAAVVAVPQRGQPLADGADSGEVVELAFARRAGQLPALVERAEVLAEVVIAALRRARAEERMQASEARTRAVFDAIDEGFCLCEMITGPAGAAVDYRFLEVNPLFSEMTGLIDPVGKTALELVPDLEPIWVQTYARVGLGGERLRFEQGSEAMDRWFDVFSMPVDPPGRFAIVFKDVTERRRAELSLRAAAAADALRAGLAEALRLATDPIAAQADVARLLGEHLGASRVHYTEFDEGATRGTVTADYHPDVASVAGEHRLDDYGASVMAELRAGRLVVVHDVRHDERLRQSERAATEGLEVGAYVMAPLQRSARTVAALVVHHRNAHTWTADELALIADSAERTWASIERLRSELSVRENEAAERKGRLRAEWLTELLSELEQIEGAQARSQRLVDRLVPTIADYAIVDAPGVAARADHEIDEAPASPLEQLGPRAQLAVPLDLGGQRGTLVLGIRQPDRAVFDAADLDFGREIADRTGVLLASARVRQEEHDISLRLQHALLPDSLVEHPDVEIEACYVAASSLLEVGGDWYDSFSWPSGEIGVCVGDVVGHGIESAASMGRLRAGAAALAGQMGPSPAALLKALDRCAKGPNGTPFATACCVVLDPGTGVLRYASAGHPPVLLVGPSGAATFLNDAQSAPLCELAPAERREAACRVQPGTTVVLYSDGLVERRGERIDHGLERLAAAAMACHRAGSSSFADSLVARMTAGFPPQDDIAVACLRYNPVRSRFRLRIPAHAAQLAELRVALRNWLATLDIEGNDHASLLLAVGEACANSIEHAYRHASPGQIDVEVTSHADKFRARIIDFGQWRPEGPHRMNRGRGTPIMASLSHRYRRQSTVAGTTVTMDLPLTSAGV